MAKGFQDAVLLEEASALDAAEKDGVAAADALKQASAFPDVAPERAAALAALADGVAGLAHDGRAAYAKMAGGHVTPDSVQASRQLAEKNDELKKSLASMRDVLAADLRAELDETVRRSARQRRTSLLVFLVSLIAAGVVVRFTIRRAITAPIRDAVVALTDGARQVTSASSQVATSSQSLSEGATQQAASLEETSASMEEMASMTRKNAENSRSAAALMGEVDAQVRASNQALGEMVASMSEIQDASRQVAKIVKTIDEIAFQTNILALNAAVEAARAGETGMGFAVVADEVRNLAQRSATAAKDTAALIEASITKAQAGGRKVEQVAGSITAITQSVTNVKGLVDEVSVASQQQAQGIDQVSQTITQMEKVTQMTAATAEESAAASEELHAQAEGSLDVVARLEALVGGKVIKRGRHGAFFGLDGAAAAQA